MTRIKFLKGWSIYNASDVASFAAHVAADLCAGDDPIAVELGTLGAPANKAIATTSRAAAKRTAKKAKKSKKPEPVEPVEAD